jgi:RES domain-containing protein
MIVYRIASCNYVLDLTGKGAALYGARWNSKETYIVYTASSRSLALLETVVHMGTLPESGFCLITIEIPTDTPAKIEAADLPTDWQQSPPPDYLRGFGDSFVRDGKNVALKVPSVIIPEEYNVLLNPRHKDFQKVKILTQQKLMLDRRLLRG